MSSAAASLAALECGAELEALSHAQLEHLVEHECDNRDFDHWFEALPAVRAARAEEAQLVSSCATLARASIDRAASMRSMVDMARAAGQRAAQAADELDTVLATQREEWAAVASAEAVERRLAEMVTAARTRGHEIKALIEGTTTSSDLESDVDSYVAAARERHRAELTLLALRNQRIEANPSH